MRTIATYFLSKTAANTSAYYGKHGSFIAIQGLDKKTDEELLNIVKDFFRAKRKAKRNTLETEGSPDQTSRSAFSAQLDILEAVDRQRPYPIFISLFRTNHMCP